MREYTYNAFTTLYIKETHSIMCSSIITEFTCQYIKSIEGDIRGALRKYSCNKLIIDIEKVRYIDSTIIGLFVCLFNECLLNGIKLHFVNINDDIKKIFRIIGVEEFFIIKKEV